MQIFGKEVTKGRSGGRGRKTDGARERRADFDEPPGRFLREHCGEAARSMPNEPLAILLWRDVSHKAQSKPCRTTGGDTHRMWRLDRVFKSGRNDEPTD